MKLKFWNFAKFSWEWVLKDYAIDFLHESQEINISCLKTKRLIFKKFYSCRGTIWIKYSLPVCYQLSRWFSYVIIPAYIRRTAGNRPLLRIKRRDASLGLIEPTPCA